MSTSSHPRMHIHNSTARIHVDWSLTLDFATRGGETVQESGRTVIACVGRRSGRIEGNEKEVVCGGEATGCKVFGYIQALAEVQV